MAIGAEVVAAGIAAFLTTIAPIISIILLVLGGIVYGIAQTQPAEEMRGKWQTAAISMFVGGLIVAAVAGAASIIQSTSSGLLRPG